MADQTITGKGIELEEGISLDLDYVSDVILIALIKQEIVREKVTIARRKRDIDEQNVKLERAEHELRVCENTDAAGAAEEDYNELLQEIEANEWWIKDSNERIELYEAELKEITQRLTQKKGADHETK